MLKLRTMQKAAALMFLVALFGAGILNVFVQLPRLRGDAASFRVPGSASALLAELGKAEALLSARITGLPFLSELYGYMQLVLGKREVGDFTVVRTLDGMLNYGNAYPLDLLSLRRYAARVGRLKNAVEAAGGKMIFLNPPDRVVKGMTRVPWGMPSLDFNPAQDAFLDLLREYGVHSLDARVSLRDNDLAPDEWIFKTDLHWTPAASFETFRDLVDEMERLSGVDLDPDRKYRDRANYHFRTYPQTFLGNLGEHVGAVFGGRDDFTAIWPAFDAEYDMEAVDPELGLMRKKGKAERTIFDASRLRPATGARRHYRPYEFYLSGSKSWAKIINLSNPGRPSLLFIHDSYGAPIVSFLAPLFGELHTIRPDAAAFPMNAELYLRDNRFDYVVVELMPYNYNDKGMNFFTHAQ